MTYYKELVESLVAQGLETSRKMLAAAGVIEALVADNERSVTTEYHDKIVGEAQRQIHELEAECDALRGQLDSMTEESRLIDIGEYVFSVGITHRGVRHYRKETRLVGPWVEVHESEGPDASGLTLSTGTASETGFDLKLGEA